MKKTENIVTIFEVMAWIVMLLGGMLGAINYETMFDTFGSFGSVLILCIYILVFRINTECLFKDVG